MLTHASSDWVPFLEVFLDPDSEPWLWACSERGEPAESDGQAGCVAVTTNILASPRDILEVGCPLELPSGRGEKAELLWSWSLRRKEMPLGKALTEC